MNQKFCIQTRAPALYDEQLQRQQQEKWLLTENKPVDVVPPKTGRKEIGHAGKE
jgi:hypothetical protein